MLEQNYFSKQFWSLPDLPTVSILRFARDLDNKLYVKLITVIKLKEMLSLI